MESIVENDISMQITITATETIIEEQQEEPENIQEENKPDSEVNTDNEQENQDTEKQSDEPEKTNEISFNQDVESVENAEKEPQEIDSVPAENQFGTPRSASPDITEVITNGKESSPELKSPQKEEIIEKSELVPTPKEQVLQAEVLEEVLSKEEEESTEAVPQNVIGKLLYYFWLLLLDNKHFKFIQLINKLKKALSHRHRENVLRS